ncbi:hypothetical protein QBC35DRAFT_29435 [Podospora australis]|uniref:Uncharacterized protein n=1 Tax=Podospora australis TaxID=1536484 RepID=A0AAN6WNM6_9PEZI|nr:hypothetical protein QBC35DRAFT_29435 [Podospora australis]
MLLLTALLAASASAVVILPGGDPKPYTSQYPIQVTTAEAYFRESAPNELLATNATKLIMSSHSVTNMSSTPGLYPSGDSFVRGAIQAWGEHLHLVIRPEEVWFTILVQMNFYMSSHAEEIRNLFVNHQGQQEILVKELTWYRILSRFKEEIQARVKTDWLLDWIMPNFSTTTDSDIMTANILMMGLTKAYFKYIGKPVCGLPSVTLLGEKSDWEKLLAKLDRLPDFGQEPEEYKARLRPILSRFVTSFTHPDSEETRLFWNQIVTGRAGKICGSPPVHMSGWITGFFYWNENGAAYARQKGDMLTLDGISYPVLDLEFAPVGYARAPFVMQDFEGHDNFPAYVAAGTLGKQITVGPPAGYKEALERAGANVSLAGDKSIHGTLKPLSGWMLYGPLSHEEPRSRWYKEDELLDIQMSVKKFMTGDTCGLVNGP